MIISKKKLYAFYTLIFLLFIPIILMAQEDIYQLPPQDIIDIVDASPSPAIQFSPNREWLVMKHRANLPSISELAQAELKIAGLRMNPNTNGPSRARHYIGLTFKKVSDGSEKIIKGLPENPHIDNISWSPNGKYIAFTLTIDMGIELWFADVKNAKAKQLTEARLSQIGERDYPFYWLSDNKTLICRFISEERGILPEAPSVPKGPIIQESIGKTAPTRTYQDLLKNPYDEILFEYYLSSQLAKVRLDGKITLIGESALINYFYPSPNGKYILLEITHRPFSYIVPYYRFPNRVEIWDLDGNVVKELIDQPLADNIPIGRGSTRTGPRRFSWRNDAPATIYWAEAQDGGDPKVETDIRDKVYMLPAPFDSEAILLATLELRYGSINWGNDNIAIISEWWWKTRQSRKWLINPSLPKDEPKLLFDLTLQDLYNDPGRLLMRRTKYGRNVLLIKDNKTIFLDGYGASPEGVFPFLDEFDLMSGETKRLWQCKAPYYERFVTFIDEKCNKFITNKESINEPLNYFVMDLATKESYQLTEFLHPTPKLANIQKELIQYEREDGVKLTATLYLPANYSTDDGPLPMLMWAYPMEFKSAASAGQVRTSEYRFIRVKNWSPILWVTQGYAILNNPTMPIIGEGDEEPNDTYIEQLVSSAQAAIDEMVRRGVADPDKIAIGGHSYGAFMTANLLTHSDLFCAGIARTGAYNRTLTPFGFQSEERSFWEAPEVYFKMSPFMHADKVNKPILLIHGEDDSNSGTFPMQSERYYNALKGMGKTVRLVMLPYESHGYRARESILHTLWETDEWMNRYVK